MATLALAGPTGRMGRAVLRAAEEHPDISGCIPIGRDAQGETLAGADALIEFTRPASSLKLAQLAAGRGLPFISGTTGFSAAEFTGLEALARRIPIFWASNFSLGVALLMQLTRQAASVLDERYDIEICEMHHRHKADAPSGTALSLGRAAAAGRGIDFDTHAVLSREGITGERAPGTIGFATLRGGGVIGEHTALFAGEHEVIELRHRSQSRDIYAQGAVRAALWLKDRPAGLYGMADLVGSGR